MLCKESGGTNVQDPFTFFFFAVPTLNTSPLMLVAEIVIAAWLRYPTHHHEDVAAKAVGLMISMAANLALARTCSATRLVLFDHVTKAGRVVVARHRIPTRRGVPAARIVRLTRPLM